MQPTEGKLRLGSRKGTYCPKWEVEASRCSIVGEHAQSGARLPAKGIDRAQSDCRMRIFVAAKALTSILTTRSMAALAPCELTQVLRGVAGCSAAHSRRACAPHACSKPVGSISRLPTSAFAASNRNVLLGSTGTSNIFFQLSWPGLNFVLGLQRD